VGVRLSVGGLKCGSSEPYPLDVLDAESEGMAMIAGTAGTTVADDLR
jgi:hypothetical protein